MSPFILHRRGTMGIVKTWGKEVSNAIEEMTDQYGSSYKIEIHAICKEEDISLRLSHVVDVGDRLFKYPFKQIDDITDMKVLDQTIMASAGHLIIANVPVLIYKEVK